jgi:hypothetical protein
LTTEQGRSDKELLIEHIKLAEERIEKLRQWTVSVHIARLRDLQGRLLEMEAWEAEPKLYSET